MSTRVDLLYVTHRVIKRLREKVEMVIWEFWIYLGLLFRPGTMHEFQLLTVGNG